MSSIYRDFPLPTDALAKLRAQPSAGNDHMDSDNQATARSILGLVGFIAGAWRLGAYHAYAVFSQQVANNFTRYVARCAIQVAEYLIKTRHLKLTFTGAADAGDAGERGRGPKRPQNIKQAHQMKVSIPWETWVDSSGINNVGGTSWGGIACGAPYSAFFFWVSILPKRLGTSSAASELVAASEALKQSIGFKMLLTEPTLQAPGPVPLNMDAEAVIEGVETERVSKESRYMAARLAMLRQANEDGVIVSTKVKSDDNRADQFTKPLAGAELRQQRAWGLGIPSAKDQDAAEPSSGWQGKREAAFAKAKDSSGHVKSSNATLHRKKTVVGRGAARQGAPKPEAKPTV